MAAGKLQEVIPTRPITYKGQNVVNLGRHPRGEPGLVERSKLAGQRANVGMVGIELLDEPAVDERGSRAI